MNYIVKLLGFSIFSSPIIIGIGTGRIAWIYTFAALNYFYINTYSLEKRYKKLIYYFYLIGLTLFYLYKSYVRIRLGVLQI